MGTAKAIEVERVATALRRLAGGTGGDAYCQYLSFLARETGYNASALRAWFVGADGAQNCQRLASTLDAERVTYDPRRVRRGTSPLIWVHRRLSEERKRAIAQAHAEQDAAKRRLYSSEQEA